MNSFNLRNCSDISYTQISNIFIDEYMPSANGTYVKVYLMLIRILSSGTANASVSGIADVLDIMDNDVVRAFNYWEKQSLINIKKDSNGVITDLTVNPVTSTASSISPSNISVVFNTKTGSDKDASVSATDTLRKSSCKDEFKWITGIIEKYMEQPLTLTDVELISYLYEELKFSSDLILHLYEYCISHGKKNTKYIETVALNWAKDGIDTVEKAMTHTAGFNTDYMEVMRAFGINQAPAPAQKQFIDAWYANGFSSEVIKEACNRTILAINEPSFKYANGILEKWHKLGVQSLNDIKNADDMYSKSLDKLSAAKSTAPRKRSTSYEQRSYSSEETSSLEQQLLRRDI